MPSSNAMFVQANSLSWSSCTSPSPNKMKKHPKKCTTSHCQAQCVSPRSCPASAPIPCFIPISYAPFSFLIPISLVFPEFADQTKITNFYYLFLMVLLGTSVADPLKLSVKKIFPLLILPQYSLREHL